MHQARRFASALAAVFVLAACAGSETASEGTQSAADPATATTPQSGDPTATDISNYELTMDGMRRWMTAAGNLARAAERDQSFDEPPDADEASMADQIAWYERTPAAREALRSAGISSRDFVMTTFAYMQAGMTDAMLSQYKDAQAPPGQNTKNLEFVRRHRAELEQMARQMGLDRSDR